MWPWTQFSFAGLTSCQASKSAFCSHCALSQITLRPNPLGRFAFVKTPRGLTGDARPRFFESYVITLCSRSRCGAREAMTVGCKPTTQRAALRAAGQRKCNVWQTARALTGGEAPCLNVQPHARLTAYWFDKCARGSKFGQYASCTPRAPSRDFKPSIRFECRGSGNVRQSDNTPRVP